MSFGGMDCREQRHRRINKYQGEAFSIIQIDSGETDMKWKRIRSVKMSIQQDKENNMNYGNLSEKI